MCLCVFSAKVQQRRRFLLRFWWLAHMVQTWLKRHMHETIWLSYTYSTLNMFCEMKRKYYSVYFIVIPSVRSCSHWDLPDINTVLIFHMYSVHYNQCRDEVWILTCKVLLDMEYKLIYFLKNSSSDQDLNTIKKNIKIGMIFYSWGSLDKSFYFNASACYVVHM